ncbi:hypothetical protein ACWDZ8_11190 [Streptomyces sp. NPDC003233]
MAGEALTSDELIDGYEELIDRFPIWSIEDGLGEDWDGWARLTERRGERAARARRDREQRLPALHRLPPIDVITGGFTASLPADTIRARSHSVDIGGPDDDHAHAGSFHGSRLPCRR